MTEPKPVQPSQSQLPSQRVSQSLTFQGPIPPPQLLEQYSKVIPNGAERIMAMAESQQKHRQSLESVVVLANVAAQSRGQVFAFLLAAVAISGGIWLIANDKNAAGLTSMISAVAGLLAVYVWGRVEQGRERTRKRQEIQDATGQGRLPLEPS